jgi:hypothetical protein
MGNTKNKKQCAVQGVRCSIYLIEKGWVNPMENRNADGYEPFEYKLTEQEAKNFCDSHGQWTREDCWSVAYHPNERMAKYRYKEIQYCA